MRPPLSKLRDSAGPARWIGAFLISVLYLGASLLLLAQETDELVIDRARPLAEALREIQRRCLCVVTYEDPRWQPDQVMVGPAVRRIPDRPPDMVPKRAPLRTSVRRDLASASRQEIAAALRGVLADYHEGPHVGEFRLLEASTAFHVVPRDGSVLDTRVTVDAADVPLGTALMTLMAEITKARKTRLVFGAVPLKQLDTVISLAATNEPAAAILTRLLVLTGQKLSWRLLYDVDGDQYFLNLAVVG